MKISYITQSKQTSVKKENDGKEWEQNTKTNKT